MNGGNKEHFNQKEAKGIMKHQKTTIKNDQKSRNYFALINTIIDYLKIYALAIVNII